MPQRFLRPGITTSDSWNACSYEAQSFYIRLLTIVDDYGRYDARASVLWGACFALRSEMTSNKVGALLEELSQNSLVQIYTVDGKDFLQFYKWAERARGASRYPAPDGAKDESAAIGKIYFIQGFDSKRIKIGFTQWNVEQRLNKLQTGSAEKLKVLGFFEGTLREERSIHRRFSSLNVGGEWFKDDKEILKFVSEKQCAQPAAIPIIELPNPASLASVPSPSHKPAHIASPAAAVKVDRVEIIRLEVEKKLTTWFKRLPNQVFSYVEQTGIYEVSRRHNILTEMEDIDLFRRKPEAYFPKSLQSLLTKWDETLDRARVHDDRQNGNQPEKKSILEKEAERMLKNL